MVPAVDRGQIRQFVQGFGATVVILIEGFEIGLRQGINPRASIDRFGEDFIFVDGMGVIKSDEIASRCGFHR